MSANALPTVDRPIDALAAQAGGALGPPVGCGDLTGVPVDLARLLEARNGFLTFGRALHVRGVGTADDVPDLVRWNGPGWREAFGPPLDGHLFFAEDVLGCQFSISRGLIWFLDPELGRPELHAQDLDAWAAGVIRDGRDLSGQALLAAWEDHHGILPAGRRLVPKTPLRAGGDFEPENFVALDATQGMRLRAEWASRNAWAR